MNFQDIPGLKDVFRDLLTFPNFDVLQQVATKHSEAVNFAHRSIIKFALESSATRPSFRSYDAIASPTRRLCFSLSSNY